MFAVVFLLLLSVLVCKTPLLFFHKAHLLSHYREEHKHETQILVLLLLYSLVFHAVMRFQSCRSGWIVLLLTLIQVVVLFLSSAFQNGNRTYSGNLFFSVYSTRLFQRHSKSFSGIHLAVVFGDILLDPVGMNYAVAQ